MNEELMKRAFSVSRADLLFNYAHNFNEVFRFAASKDDPATSKPGVVEQAEAGFDFKKSFSPYVEVNPISKNALHGVGVPIDELSIHISLEDIGLAIRKPMFSFPMASVTETSVRRLLLHDQRDMSFYRGFVVRCFITRSENVGERGNVIWNKSQVLYETSFIVKSSTEDAFFNIVWADFSNPNEDQDVLYVVEWTSHEVSTKVDVDCFQVKINKRLKNQFNRLDRDLHFGEMCIRMIVFHVLSELLLQTLRYAKTGDGFEPEVDSLHQKFQIYLDKHGENFTELAERFQSADPQEQIDRTQEAMKLLQITNSIGTTLENIKF